MKATDLFVALEPALEAYKRTNNALAFVAALGDGGFRIVRRDLEAESRREEDDAHYTRMWESVGRPQKEARDE